jgi:eukaryotic-like serine/threonine-protein kinase
MALQAGSRLGPYSVVGLLGLGGMGEVYRARDPRLDREVAIKVLPDEIADPRRLRRFEQEARTAGALNHPNVLAVYDVGTHEGALYVVSELLEGQTVQMRLAGGPLPLRRALDYALQIAHGLAATHDKGIVHRDLKPQNVFVTEDGRVKILDFGLAKLTRPHQLVEEEEERLGTGSTSSGAEGMGTVGYMSPEQVRGEPVDHRSDIFSFGAVLFEMLSGTRAFRRGCAAETMNAILKEDPPELRGSTPGISPGLVRLVYRCLEKRAGDRFRSAHDLALALETVSSERPGAEDGASHAALVVRLATRHKKLSLATVAAIVLAGGFYGFYRALAPAPATPVTDVIDSLAVLPFENVGGHPDSEYLSDGVAESLIDELSRRPDLKVMARSTSFRFRGKDVDPRQVGRDLDVGAVLTGRVSARGDTLLIGAELVDVARGPGSGASSTRRP